MTVQGSEARLFRYTGSYDFVATWSRSGYGVQARAVVPDLDTFTALVVMLYEVSVDAWLSAMPESVVKPEGRSKIVLQKLEGVPLPPGTTSPPSCERATMRFSTAINSALSFRARLPARGSIAGWPHVTPAMTAASARQPERSRPRTGGACSTT